MPTKIILRGTVEHPASPMTRRGGRYPDVENQGRRITQSEKNSPDFPRRRGSKKNPLVRQRASSRKIIGFGMTIMSQLEHGLSERDIRASPRLAGYFVQLLASVVMLITVLKFITVEHLDMFEDNSSDVLIVTTQGEVCRWKLIGAVVTSATLTGVNGLIVFVHFDTVCLPQLWLEIFRDSSMNEWRLVSALFLCWIVTLHICSSTLSIGHLVPNVFFGSWIGLLSSIVNYGVWRVSAGYKSIAERVNLHHRETTYNWVWTLFFLVVAAASTLDLYLTKQSIPTDQYNGSLSQQRWITVLLIEWSFVLIVLIALTCNVFMREYYEIELWGTNRLVLGWRQVEGIVALGIAATFFYMVYEYTGVNTYMSSGLSNSYFGFWGAFFNAVLTLGTWLRENKNIALIVHDDDTTRMSTPNNSPARRLK